MSYESPIAVTVMKDMQSKMDEHLRFTVSQTVGFDVNRDELIKALEYDRQQYQKGYEDALYALEKFRRHDLRKDPMDLPTNPLNSVIAWDTNYKSWLFAQYNGREWIVSGNGQTYHPNVIGWTEMLEPFEVEE